MSSGESDPARVLGRDDDPRMLRARVDAEGLRVLTPGGLAVVATTRDERPVFTHDSAAWLDERGFEVVWGWHCEFDGWTVGPPPEVRPDWYSAGVRVRLLTDWAPEARCGLIAAPHVTACYCSRPEHGEGPTADLHACACGALWREGPAPDRRVQVLIGQRRRPLPEFVLEARRERG